MADVTYMLSQREGTKVSQVTGPYDIIAEAEGENVEAIRKWIHHMTESKDTGIEEVLCVFAMD